MSQDNMRLHFMPQDSQQWRIDWYGDVCYPNFAIRRSMPSICVTLSLWNRKGRQTGILQNTNRHLTQIYAPVGFLNKIRIGDIWKNGKLIGTTETDVECFKDIVVDNHSTSIIKSGLSTYLGSKAAFYLPLQHHPFHLLHTQSYCLKVELPSNKRLIIPAIELIRFYFGSSSSLLSCLFQFPLMPEKLWVTAKKDEDSNFANIVLSPGISGWSAADVARIAFDSIAWHTAQLVGNSISAAKIYQQSLYPKAHFPFNGKTTISANGVWVPFDDDPKSTFVVHRLMSCSHKFPFKKLEYRLAIRTSDNYGDYHHQETLPEPKPFTSETGKVPITTKNISNKYVEADPSKNLGTVEKVIENQIQFNDLLYKSVRKISNELPSEVDTQPLSGSSVIASSVGTGDTIGSVRPVDLVRQSDWGLHCEGPFPLMRELAANLSASERYDVVELINLSADEQAKVCSYFVTALNAEEFEGSDINNGKRIRTISKIQIASVAKRSVRVYLLVAEICKTSKLTPLCLSAVPLDEDSCPTVLKITAALDMQRHFEVADEFSERQQYFLPMPASVDETNLDETIRYLCGLLETYCDIFQTSVLI